MHCNDVSKSAGKRGLVQAFVLPEVGDLFAFAWLYDITITVYFFRTSLEFYANFLFATVIKEELAELGTNNRQSGSAGIWSWHENIFTQ